MTGDGLRAALEAGAHDEAATILRQSRAGPPEERASYLRSVRSLAEDDPGAVAPVVPDVAPCLSDDRRPVRLATAKALVSVARHHPDAVEPVVDELSARLADAEEFYFVRARAAEALGFVALAAPGSVATPEVVAELRIGLSRDQPELRRKLAKALALVALGDPGRLRHHVEPLTDHLDDVDLVRYHLATAVAAIGCDRPSAVVAEADRLGPLLADDCAQVRGRVAEAFGIVARAAEPPEPVAQIRLDALVDDPDPFVARRGRFLARGLGEEAVGRSEPPSEPVGTVPAIRETAVEAATAIEAPDGDSTCRACGRTLPANGPPLCPDCGAPF